MDLAEVAQRANADAPDEAGQLEVDIEAGWEFIRHG